MQEPDLKVGLLLYKEIPEYTVAHRQSCERVIESGLSRDQFKSESLFIGKVK